MAQSDDSLVGHPLRGVSVHHLEHDFLDAVHAAGLSRDSKVYEVEPLVIRPKGQGETSPRSGKLGASYVDSIRGADHAGLATAMLSYTWGYAVGDVIGALAQHCEMNPEGLGKTRTYVWICCLCINQHRVQEERAAGRTVPFEAFQAAFGDRVRGVGRILALMAPWDEPLYVTRVWCVFELYIAVTEGAELTVLMPPLEARKLCRALERGSYSKRLWASLEGVRVEEAQASVQADRDNIMRLVEEGQGYERTNEAVRQRLLRWFAEASASTCSELVADGTLAGDSVASCCVEVAALLRSVGRLHRAGELLAEGRGALGEGGLETQEGANLLRVIGQNEGDLGHSRLQLQAYGEAEAVLRRLGRWESHDGAALLTCVANSRQEQGDLRGALQSFREAWQVRRAIGSQRTLDAADLLGMLGSLQCRLGDASGLAAIEQGVQLRRELGAMATPGGARVLQQLGAARRQLGSFREATEALQEAVAIVQAVGASNTPLGVGTVIDLGLCKDFAGDVDGALQTWEEAREALRLAGMEASDAAADLACHVAFARAEKGDARGRVAGYEEAYRLRAEAGSLETPQGARLLVNLGYAKGACGDTQAELELYAKARRWREETSTLRSLDGATLLQNIGGAHLAQRRRGPAKEALRLAEEILADLDLQDSACARDVRRLLRRAGRPLGPCCALQ